MRAKKKATSEKKPVKVRIYKNNSKTSEEAPYLAKVVPEATLDFDGFVAEMQKDMPNATRPQIAMYIRAMTELISAKLREGYKVETPIGLFELHITGTADHADSPFDPTRNKLVVKITPARELQKALAKLDVEVINAPTSDLALSGVETPSLGRAGVDAIKAGEVFMITGRGFSDGTLTAEVIDSTGTVHALTLTLIKALYAQSTAPTNLAAGEAQLTLTLTDANSNTFTSTRKVTVVA